MGMRKRYGAVVDTVNQLYKNRQKWNLNESDDSGADCLEHFPAILVIVLTTNPSGIVQQSVES